MNDPTLIGPCADYEHDLVELTDGALSAERAGTVRAHLAQCARCQAWVDGFAALDARLAAALPEPTLSPQFDARLRERIATLSRPATRGDLRARLEREHDALVGTLQQAARRRAVLGAAGSVAASLCMLAAMRDVLAQHAAQLQAVAGGAWLVPGALGALVVVGALAWSAREYMLPSLGFGR
jgi:anti-sigma factor RsiW